MANIFQQQIVAEKPKSLPQEKTYVYVPVATADTPGIAAFDSNDFNILNSKVSIKRNDPTQVPSLIKIKDKTEGLEAYKEGNEYYLRTYLKTINDESLNAEEGETNNIELVTVHTEQNVDGKKIFVAGDINDEIVVITGTPVDSPYIGITPNSVIAKNGDSYTAYKNGEIVIDGETTITLPSETGTLALTSELEEVDAKFATKVNIETTSGNWTSKVQNNGTGVNLLTEGTASGIKVESQVLSGNMLTAFVRKNTTIATNKAQSSMLIMGGEFGYFVSENEETGNSTTLKVASDGVYIDNIIIPKVVNTDSTSANDAYNTVYINSKLSGINTNITNIQLLIPEQASSSNQLADRAFVNSSINNMAAYYITYNAEGDPFPTHEALEEAEVFYNGGQVRIPTRNDYCIVRTDEDHDDATTRYSYQNNQWEFQYIVNETPLTADQIAALNSGITTTSVAQIGTNATNISLLQSGKQNVLTAGSNITISNDTISATDTTYSAGTGLILTGTTFGVDTSVIQEKLTFDSVPTENSTNPVTSGGIYNVIPEPMSLNQIDEIMNEIFYYSN